MNNKNDVSVKYMQAFMMKIQKMQSTIAKDFYRKVSESNLDLAIDWMRKQCEQSIKNAHFYAFILTELEKWEECIQVSAKIL